MRSAKRQKTKHNNEEKEELSPIKTKDVNPLLTEYFQSLRSVIKSQDGIGSILIQGIKRDDDDDDENESDEDSGEEAVKSEKSHTLRMKLQLSGMLSSPKAAKRR